MTKEQEKVIHNSSILRLPRMRESGTMSNEELRFPSEKLAPRHPLKKPRKGKYHVVRFIRSDGLLDVFGEKILVPPETHYEYVIATIDVKEQKLKLYLDKTQVDEIDYKMF